MSSSSVIVLLLRFIVVSFLSNLERKVLCSGLDAFSLSSVECAILSASWSLIFFWRFTLKTVLVEANNG